MGSFLPVNIYRKPQLVMAIASILAVIGLVVWIEPSFVANVLWKDSYLPFYVLVELSLLWLLTAISGRWKRSLLWSLSITIALWLRSQQLDTIATLGLLVLFNLVWAYYWKITKVNPTSID